MILIIACNYLMLESQDKFVDRMKYLDRKCTGVTLILNGDFRQEMITELSPDVICFAYIDRMRDDALFEQVFGLNNGRVPICLMAIDLFHVRTIVAPSKTFHKLDAIIAPIKHERILNEYRQIRPDMKVYNLSSRFVDITVFKERRLEKKYDILYYGNNFFELSTNSNVVDDEYYRGSIRPHKDNFYPFRKRLYDLFSSSSDRFRVKILKPRTTHNATIRNVELSQLLNQSWLAIATCSRSDYLMDKYLEIAASGCGIIGNCPSDYRDLFEDKIVEVTPNMSDDEILTHVELALSDKSRLQRRIDSLSYTITSRHNYTVMTGEFLSIMNQLSTKQLSCNFSFIPEIGRAHV